MNDKQTSIQQLKEMVRKFREERGWGRQDIKDYPIGLVLEAAEVMELFQWLSGEDVKGNDKLKRAIAEEMADVLYWLMVIADDLNIDLTEVFERKDKKRRDKYPLGIFGADKDKEEKRRA